MTPTTKDVLVEAKRLLVEKGHTTCAFARDANGEVVNATDPHAKCFCAFGAVRAAAVQLVGASAAGVLVMRAVDALEAQGNFENLMAFNDKNTTAAVLELFDKTIAATS